MIFGLFIIVIVMNMNRCLLVFLFYTVFRLDAQIVFSEIMYNDPGSGVDSLEFVEFYNHSSQPIDLTNYSISDGVSFTFPQYTLASESYVVVCKFPQTLKNVFGLSDDDLFGWSDTGSVSLNNNGEILQLSDANGLIIDEVEYFPTDEWHQEKVDGFGHSLEFCDYTLDNNIGSSWFASQQVGNFTYTGVDTSNTNQTSSFSVYATPKTGCFETSFIFEKNHSPVFYPNPFQDELTVPQNSAIYSLSGQLINDETFQQKMDTSDLIPGIYLLKINNRFFKVIKF